MSDFDCTIPFPCFSGCSGRAEGPNVYIQEFTTRVDDKECVPLFTARYLVEEFFQNGWLELDSQEKLTIHAFEEVEDLADYLLHRWLGEAGWVSHYVLIGHYGNNLGVPELIPQLLYNYDKDALKPFIRHCPYCDTLVDDSEGVDRLIFSTVTSVFNTGSFVLFWEGYLQFPEGMRIEANESGQLGLLDEHGALKNVIHAGFELTCWSGVLRFARGEGPLEFEFETTDTGTWRYRYDPEMGWYELKLSGEATSNPDAALPSGLIRCPVCQTWNRHGEVECTLCKALLMVPHCRKCGAELENEADPCPVCEGSDDKN